MYPNDDKIDLTPLLANTQGYKALLAYLERQLNETESDYMSAASATVFTPEAREGALIIHGKRRAYSEIIHDLKALAKGTTSEGI